MHDPSSWIYVDFETLPIERRPKFPPKAVGVAIKWPGKPSQYYAFAHPRGGNTHTETQARHALLAVWSSGLPVCFHNAKFDLAVAGTLGLPPLDADLVHDTQLALFIRNPRAETYKLKPSAEKLLGEPPEERDRVIDWLVLNQPVPGVRMTKNEKPSNGKNKKSPIKLVYAGAYVAFAPVPLVASYARGDVDRTKRLAEFLLPDLEQRKLVDAYDRERLLLDPIMSMEAWGAPVDVARLSADVGAYQKALAKVEGWLSSRTHACGVNWDSPQELVKALVEAGLADTKKLGRTPKSGKLASNKDALARGVTDSRVLSVLKYRSRVLASLRTFMLPWLTVAKNPLSKGRIFTDWRTTTTDEGGARTGRMASSPNFQNLIKRKVYLFGKDKKGNAKPAPAWWRKLDLPDLPWVRGYIVPFRGHVLVDRDYSQQELRILAHYTGGELLTTYQKDNWLDVHAFVQGRVHQILGELLDRETIKTTVFRIIYGGGVGGLAEALGCTVERAEQIRNAVIAAVPGLRELRRKLREMADTKMPIRTWGGRQYYVEKPRWVDGKLRTFEYKLLNLLIQGSAADCTKSALLKLWEMIRVKHPTWRILLAVHDEFVLSVPRSQEAKAHKVLAEAMASVQFDLPMLSEGKSGPTWGSLKKFDEKGRRCNV